MNILFINPTSDSNDSHRQASAIKKYTSHNVRHFSAVKTFYNTVDIGPENYNRDEFVSLIEAADILHFCSDTHDRPSTHNWGFNWDHFLGRKIKIFHDYNNFPGYWRDLCTTKDYWNKRNEIGYDAIFSSVPQANYIYEGCVYIPDLVDEFDPWYTPESDRDMTYLKLCHFPTGSGNSENTEEFNAALTAYPVFNFMVPGGAYQDILSVKKMSNFGFDNLWRGFHSASTVENLALGIPTMCNIEPEFDYLFKQYFESDESPFEHVRTVEDIVRTMTKYACDNALLRARCEQVRQFMLTKWSAKIIAENIVKEYEKL
jgi:hypothetical protein